MEEARVREDPAGSRVLTCCFARIRALARSWSWIAPGSDAGLAEEWGGVSFQADGGKKESDGNR